MKLTKPQCYYYPTTVVILDDNQTFLDNLPSNLSNRSLYTLFDSPEEALKFLQEHRHNLPTPEDFYEITDDFSTGIPLHVNIQKIQSRLNDSARFKTPSVIIVDHDMPGMNGIEFCRRLGDYPIKKIMLTGVADDKLAIQAFNDGIINKFILKDDPTVFESIDKAVHELQQDYFASLSELIVKNITTTSFSLLQNKAFQDFFLNFLEENKIREFYLTEATGSFLLLNIRGESIRLIVQSDEHIENFVDVAKDHEASLDIISALRNKEKLICLLSEEDYKKPVEKWYSHMHPAKKIYGLSNIYYSVVKANQTIPANIS